MTTHSSAATPARRLGLSTTDLTMLAVVIIWGMNFSIMKSALAEIPPLTFAGMRFALGSLLLWLVLRAREGAALPPRSSWRRMIWVGLIGNTIYQAGFVYGLRLTSAANSALIIATVPAMVALAGALLGIERLSRRIVIGVALATVGVALVVAAHGLEVSSTNLLGDLLLLACALAWTAYTLGVRTVQSGLSPLAITTWTTIIGMPGLVLIGLPDALRTDWSEVSGWAWVGLLYAAVMSLVVAYLLWNNSVRVAGSNRTAIFSCMTPLVAALGAWPLLGEVPTALQGVGAALIIAGVLATRYQPRAG